eukprot:5329134-Prymnesium_polylepis.2
MTTRVMTRTCPRSMDSHCGSLQAEAQRLFSLPSTALSCPLPEEAAVAHPPIAAATLQACATSVCGELGGGDIGGDDAAACSFLVALVRFASDDNGGCATPSLLVVLARLAAERACTPGG